jgi:hypothetical protein
MTDSEIHDMIALTENLMKELEGFYWEQQQRVNIVAPIVAAMLNVEKTNCYSVNRYTAEWNSPLLTLWESGNSDPIMKAEWDKEMKCWREQDSFLTQEITDYFSEEVKPVVQSLIKQELSQQASIKKQNQQASIKKQKSKGFDLEL